MNQKDAQSKTRQTWGTSKWETPKEPNIFWKSLMNLDLCVASHNKTAMCLILASREVC